MAKNLYPEYIKNSYGSIILKHPISNFFKKQAKDLNINTLQKIYEKNILKRYMKSSEKNIKEH